MKTRRTKQGEHVARIARETGLGRHTVIWDHPENAGLRSRRANPNVLFPGDVLRLPEKQQRIELGSTDATHRFRATPPRLRIRLRLLDIGAEPLEEVACALHFDGSVKEHQTDSDGLLEQAIPETLEDFRLVLENEGPFGRVRRLRVGHLDPIDEVSGQQARLANLGYFLENEDDRAQARLALAIEEFQCDHGLSVDRICGPKTQSELVKAHGC